ncbi:BQ2448_4146 [Microbotryum intermedium]|uniref:BQ2448_4146 protein n=1 Tax=Microbotryum intermedium TaxID=269621 RepID=A0A238FIJ1_9BASI|nr:BQ2448_4146 [Microbotryum intermedium]
MPPRKHPLTVFQLKLNKTTVFLPVSSSSTLSSLRSELIEALKHGRDTEVDPLPTSADQIALWRSSGIEGEETWTRLTDEKSTADKWGLQEAAEIGVSIQSSDGTFPEPTVERPVDSDGEE